MLKRAFRRQSDFTESSLLCVSDDTGKGGPAERTRVGDGGSSRASQRESGHSSEFTPSYLDGLTRLRGPVGYNKHTHHLTKFHIIFYSPIWFFENSAAFFGNNVHLHHKKQGHETFVHDSARDLFFPGSARVRFGSVRIGLPDNDDWATTCLLERHEWEWLVSNLFVSFDGQFHRPPYFSIVYFTSVPWFRDVRVLIIFVQCVKLQSLSTATANTTMFVQ